MNTQKSWSAKMVCGWLHLEGHVACHSIWHHAPHITAEAAEAAQLHLPVCHGEAHVAHCLVLIPCCCCSSRSRPSAVLLLLLLLHLTASLMRLRALMFLLLAELLPDVKADICVDDTVCVCLHRRQHCLLCSLPDGVMPLCSSQPLTLSLWQGATQIDICTLIADPTGVLLSIWAVLMMVKSACLVIQASPAPASRLPFACIAHMHGMPSGSQKGACPLPCTSAHTHLKERLLSSRLLRAGSRHHAFGKGPGLYIKHCLAVCFVARPGPDRCWASCQGCSACQSIARCFSWAEGHCSRL